jgi:threonine aldolase
MIEDGNAGPSTPRPRESEYLEERAFESRLARQRYILPCRMTYFDLRSDTVTRPTAGMRKAMSEAEVGDDVYSEDPSVRALEERVAGLLGKERALFVPSGTMANQIALLLHTRPGDDVIVGERTHCLWYESRAAAAWSGVQFSIAGSGGLFTAEQMESVLKPQAYYLPHPSLVVLENTHNRAGGRVFPLAEVRRISERARAHRLALHLDGARLWNASVATGVATANLCEMFDTVSVCFSKGLGAPVGSALSGSVEAMERARRFRKMLGGGMRQSGVLAQAASYALDHHVERLAEDHRAAKVLAQIVAQATGAIIDPGSVETNIVNVGLKHAPADEVVRRAREHDVLVSAISPSMLRAVTHLGIAFEEVRVAAERLARVIELTPAATPENSD